MENNYDDFFSKLKKLSELEDTINGDNHDIETISEINKTMESLSKDFNQELLKRQNILDVKIKKLHDNAIIPKYAKNGDAGLDLTATSFVNETPSKIVYSCGLSLEIPHGYVGLVFPRSSIRNKELQLANSVGVIDSGYRGDIQVTFNKTNGNDSLKYSISERIAQIIIVPYPSINFIEVDELSESERGVDGHGSSGK